MGDSQVIRYAIDGMNVVSAIEGPWDEFARENDAPECRRDYVLGRTLFDFVRAADVVDIYTRLFAVVRRDRRPIEFAFRCDGPRFRREMRMYLSPLEGDGLELRTELVESTERDSQALMDRGTPRTEALVRMCSYCNRFYVPEHGWREVEDAVETLDLFGADRMPLITHGLCERCLVEQEALLENRGESA